MSHLTASDELVNFTHLYHQHVGILCHHTFSTRNDCLELGGKKNESVGLSLESDSLWVCSQWTVAHQAPPFMEFPGQEYWSGLPFPSQGIVPTQGSNPALLHCRQILYCLSHRSCQMNNCTMMRHCYLNTAKVRGKKWGTVVKGKWRLRYISNFT